MMGGDRQAFVGAYVKPEVRDALRGYVSSIDHSVSEWLSMLIERELRDLHVPIVDWRDKGPKLPFEKEQS
jgi:hypothetical protein